MNVNRIDVLLRNNTGNKNKHALIDSFVVRTKIFQTIFSEIKSSTSDKPEQNYLLIGQRGAGKTTLLFRLKYAIEDDVKLKVWLLPVILPEEQYNITELFNLWESVAEYMEDIYKWEALVSEINKVSDKKNAGDLAYDIIEKNLKQHSKKIVVFIENINHFFTKIGKTGQQRLREILLTTPNIRIIGSSTSYFDEITNYSAPFYDFFKVYQLKGLSKEESKLFLLKLGEQYGQLHEIEDLIKNNAKRIESLRRLTGGIPRIMSYLFQIFIDNKNGGAIVDLYELLEQLTFLYKAELDQLSTQQQKIIDVIARNWDAISTKDIAHKTRIDSKQVSSVLNALEKDQVIESVSTKTKNKLYRVRDRFLNIWYLMRFGKKKERENVIWLVRFYDAWCNKTELSKKVEEHLNNLKEGVYDTKAALDMGNTFLSCEGLPASLKFDVYRATKSLLPKELKKDLNLSDKDLKTTIDKLIKNKEYDKAIDALNETDERGVTYYFLLSRIYSGLTDFNKYVEALQKVFELTENTEIALIIGRLNKLLDKTDDAIRYLNIALEDNNYIAATILGEIYAEMGDIDKAKEYFQIAIDKGINDAIMLLAKVYFEEKNYSEAEKLCKNAIEKGNDKAINNLGIILEKAGKTDEAISSYKKAIEQGFYIAYLNWGTMLLSLPTPKPDETKELFEKALQKGVPNANSELGRLYLHEKNYTESLKYLKAGVAKKEPQAAHLLAHYYENTKDWTKAEKLFTQSFDWGTKKGIICLFNGAFLNLKNERKSYILEQFEKNQEYIQKSGPLMVVKFAKLLLWNGKIEMSINKLASDEKRIVGVLQDNDKEYSADVVAELTDYFILLIAKGQYNAAFSLLAKEEPDYKQILKPVYFALMNYMKEEYPQEYLKAGEELKETVDEVIKNIEDYKVKYK